LRGRRAKALVMKSNLIHAVAGAVLAAVVAATAADAQAPPAAQQGPEAPQPQTAPLLTPELLNQMVAPIALYPDELLGEILMAATYPLDVVEAARWLQDPRNASLKGDQLIGALQQQNWDPSVKLLATGSPSSTRIVGRLAARSGGMTRSTGATSPIATRRSPPDMAQRRRVGRSPAVSTSLRLARLRG
jgi:hypothetical protein